MKTGRLFYDSDTKRTLTQKIDCAAESYRNMYGFLPDTVYVNPLTAGEGIQDAKYAVSLKVSRSILPNHFWIGMAEEVTA